MSVKSKNESPKVFHVSLAETFVVPGHHEMILPAKFKGAVCGDSVLGVVEQSLGFSKQPDLLLTRVLAKTNDDMVPVRVINSSPAPVTPTPGGTFSQLEDGALDPSQL